MGVLNLALLLLLNVNQHMASTLDIVLDPLLMSAAPKSVEVIAGGGGEDKPRRQVRVATDENGHGQLTLDDRGRWEVTCEAEGVWCPTVKLDQERQRVVLPVYPALALQATLDVPHDLPPPASLTVTMSFVGAKGALQRTEQVVAVTDRTLAFKVPRTELDLRIGGDGFVPIYRWSLPTTKPAFTWAG